MRTVVLMPLTFAPSAVEHAGPSVSLLPVALLGKAGPIRVASGNPFVSAETPEMKLFKYA
jgi:hypothetical protein